MIADSGTAIDGCKGSRRGAGVKLGWLGGELSHAVSIQGEAVGVVHEAVEDGVGDGRVPEHRTMPQLLIG